MKKLIMLLAGVVIFSVAYSQKVKVSDLSTLSPIASVIIASGNISSPIVTDNNGEADISSFANSSLIRFTMVGFITEAYSYEKLKEINFEVKLIRKSYSIDEVVVSASRFEEKIRDVVQPVQVMSSRDLKFISQQTSADVLQSSGNIFVQKSQQGGGSPIIRGFETNKVLLVIDGVRLNNAIYRGGHLQNVITLDNSVLDKVEILFGPGSVVYGSDALGGVMHFYTRNPLRSKDGEKLVSANAYTRYATANKEKTGHVDFNIGLKNFASLTSFTYSDFGDLRQGNNRNPFYGDWGKRTFYVDRINRVDSMIKNDDVNVQIGSGYKQYDFLQKFLFSKNDNATHTLNFQYSTSSNVPRYDRLTLLGSNGNPRFAEWYYGPQERLMVSYKLKLQSASKFYDAAQIIAAYQLIEESRYDRSFRSDNLNQRVEDLGIYTLNADFAKKIRKNEIRYGVDAWYNKVISTASVRNITTFSDQPLSTRYPSGGSYMQSAALYATHSWEINDKLILNDGLRLNYVSLNSKFSDTTFYPFPFTEVTQDNLALNGNIGLVYMPSKKWRLTGLISSGFRAPNVDDLSKVFESVPGKVIIPNPDLGPEYTYNFEAGISKTWNESISLGANAFHTIYKDAITTTPGKFNGQDSIIYDGQMSQVITNVNKNEAYLRGLSAVFNADVTNHFSINSTLNYTFGRIKTDTTDYPLDHIPPVFGRTGFNLNLSKFRGEFFLMYSGAKLSKDYNLIGEDNRSYSADPVNGFMPAWYTLNVRTAYQFNKNIQLQLAIENILDQNYRLFSSNISAAGRNLMVTLRGQF